MKTLLKITFVMLVVISAVSCIEKKPAERTDGVTSDTSKVVTKVDTVSVASDTVVNR